MDLIIIVYLAEKYISKVRACNPTIVTTFSNIKLRVRFVCIVPKIVGTCCVVNPNIHRWIHTLIDIFSMKKIQKKEKWH